MSASDSETSSYTFANWRRQLEGVPVQDTNEAMLFTDAVVTSEVVDLGPYAFLNTMATASSPRSLRRAIVLRVAHHYNPLVDPAYRIPMETDSDHYHGGDYLDEIAALASLFMGVRLKAGGINREFRAEGDPLGRPFEFAGKPDPQLVVEGRIQIPRLSQSANLNQSLEALRLFPSRTVQQTNVLIKAARQYQQAIWIADADPGLAWLMLVSALETVAVEWASKTAPTEQLKMAFPKIVKLISESSCPSLLDPIAKELDRLTRATKRFVDFILAFAPAPPAERPADYLQFSYEPSNLENAVKLIYSHRSRSLHEGIAFPRPMCVPPRYLDDANGPREVQEKPGGLAMYSDGASWRVEQTPMLLNTFEHITRGVLSNWWKQA
jgi:hypothetical protein